MKPYDPPPHGDPEKRGYVAIFMFSPHHKDPRRQGDVAILMSPHHGDREKAGLV